MAGLSFWRQEALAAAWAAEQDGDMRLSDIGEFGFIRRIARGRRAGRSVVLGLGDDAAAVRVGAGKLLLVTCDPVIEGIHFDATATDEQIGWKAMMRNVSDLAAMGGAPRWAVVSAALPRDFPLRRALAIQRGLDRAAKRCGVEIVGGDTARSRSGIQITVTALGDVASRKMVTRAGARPGHALLVTGALGGSRARKHRTFTPRMAEARFLAERGWASAMMDLSDGLASDLERLRERSGVGFEVFADKIPISAAARRGNASREARVRCAMEDGEDYELVFTTPPAKVARLRRAWARRFSLALTQIGVARPRAFGIRVTNAGARAGAKLMVAARNDHFLRNAREGRAEFHLRGRRRSGCRA